MNEVTGHQGSLPPSTPDRSATGKSRWHLVVGGLLALGVLLAARSIDVEHYVSVAQRWAEPMGLLGPVVYGLVYVAVTLLGAPSMPFTVLAPVLFGVATGAVTMVAASSVSAAGGFLIARYLARDAVAARLADSPAFVRMRDSSRPRLTLRRTKSETLPAPSQREQAIDFEGRSELP